MKVFNARKRKSSPLRTDPTRTTLLRSRLVAEVRRRFKRVRLAVYDMVAVQDAFGLGERAGVEDYFKFKPIPKLTLTNRLTTNQRWRFLSDPEKVKAFQAWLKGLLAVEILGKDEEELWERYIQEGFAKGAGRAFDDTAPKLKRFSPGEGAGFLEGSRAQFLRDSFGRPEAVEKVKLLAGRSFSDLEGVTEQMSKAMTRVLTDGLVQGKDPREVARDLTNQVDGLARPRAETIARTELIRAHAEGQLTAFELLGVEEVGAAVEWLVTDDERLCELCAPLEGVVLKVDEARGMLPRHPNCRCAWIPANVGEDDKDQKDTKGQIDKAVGTSRGRGAGEDDEWGPGAKIAKDRPKGTFNSRFERFWDYVNNAFCPTGVGGGTDPTCSPGTSGGGTLGPTAKTGLSDLRAKRDAARAEMKQAAKRGEGGVTGATGPAASRYYAAGRALATRREQVSERRKEIGKEDRVAEKLALKIGDLQHDLPDSDNRGTPSVLRRESLARLKNLPVQLLDVPVAERVRYHETVRSLAIKASASIAGVDTSRLDRGDRKWVASTVARTRKISLLATRAVRRWKNAQKLARDPFPES